MTIKWPVEGIIVQKNKSCFYSHFITESSDGFTEQRQYRCGDIIFVKIDRRMPPLLAEITHLWVCKNLKGDDDGKIRIRLFSRPEDTPHGRSHHHGEHELLMFHKPAVMTCKQFLSLEQNDVQWNVGLPLQPQHDVPPSPSSLLSSNSSTTALLYCNETMMPVGGFEDQTGASPTTSPVLTRSPPPLQYKLRVISFSAYCRYRAVLKRFETQPFEFMDLPLVQALGGIAIPQVPTMIVFCHKTFRDICLERKISLLEGNSSLDMVTFKTDSLVDSSQHIGSGRGHFPKRKRGRPRKTELSSQQSQSNAPPIKRKRGRPRKNPPCETTPTTCSTTSDITESTPLLTPSTFNSDCQTNGVVFCSNDPLQQDDNKTTEIGLMFPAKPFIAGPAELAMEESIVHKYNGCHQTDMLTLLTTQSNSDISDTNSSDISSISPTNKCHSLVSSHLFSNAAVPHSLRPRSTLQPPSQFRDIYDIESAQVIVAENKSKVQQPQVIPRQYKAKIDRLTNPLSTQDLSSNETVLTSSTISLDVKQLLRAHLSQTQTSTVGDTTWTHSTLENLESHLLEEKNFLDLLFCFMKMRNTPIHRIPRLGSKYLNLYELFKATSNYGGYDQVTLNRKWSSVFDSMGYSTGMTCASTVTRRHYEKLLLPFEKALAAMKENTSCTV